MKNGRFWKTTVLCILTAFALYVEIILLIFLRIDWTRSRVQEWPRRLVLERKADFLGTDTHRTYHRPPSAEMGLKWLYKNTDPEYADTISWGNARKLLNIFDK